MFTTTISGCSSWYEIEDYAEEYKDDLVTLYERISGESSSWGVPSHDTLNRAIIGLQAVLRGEGRDAERKHNKSRVARMATRLCYVGEPAGLTPQARDSQTD